MTDFSPALSGRRLRTRARLLRAADRIFASRGYHGATLADVAATAGLTKGAVYYNSDSKEDVFLTLLQDRLEQRLRDVAATFSSGTSAEQSAQQAARSFFSRLEQDPRWSPPFFEFVAYAAREPRLRRAVGRRFFDIGRDTLEGAISSVFDQAGVKAADLSPRDAATAIAALANGLALDRLFAPESVPNDRFGDVLTLLLQGMAAAPAETTEEVAA